jgi:hypothetical protein
MVTGVMASQSRQQGFTYLVLLMAVAYMGWGCVAISELWHTSAMRERSAQSRWAATQMVAAIGSYYHSNPAVGAVYPTNVNYLLQDPRFSYPKRHLRQVYANPFARTQSPSTLGTDWRWLPCAPMHPAQPQPCIMGLEYPQYDLAQQQLVWQRMIFAPFQEIEP